MVIRGEKIHILVNISKSTTINITRVSISQHTSSSLLSVAVRTHPSAEVLAFECETSFLHCTLVYWSEVVLVHASVGPFHRNWNSSGIALGNVCFICYVSCWNCPLALMINQWVLFYFFLEWCLKFYNRNGDDLSRIFNKKNLILQRFFFSCVFSFFIGAWNLNHS